MSPEKLQELVAKTPWRRLGEGTFNTVGLSETELTIGNYKGLWVYKRQLGHHAVSRPERAVRKWNLLNPKFPAWLAPLGWLAPYIEGKQASDLQIALKLVEIYHETRIIIADAGSERNFITRPDGRVFCVDMDMTLRRGSIISDRENIHRKEFKAYFAGLVATGYNLTATIIQNLSYLEKELREESIDNSFISYRTILSLTDFRINGARITRETMMLLAKIETLDAENELHSQFFSPGYINWLLAVNASSPIETKAQLFDLIYNFLNSKSSPTQLIKDDNLEGLKFLIKQKPALLTPCNIYGSNLLRLAVYNNRLNIVEYLIQQGMPVNEPTSAASSQPNQSLVDFAILHRMFPIVRLLLDNDAIISLMYLNHPLYLFYAASQGLLELVRSLIHANPAWANFCDSAGQNALLWAACGGHGLVVDLLLNHGADPNYAIPGSSTNGPNDNNTPLDLAIASDDIVTIRRLVQVKARTNKIHEGIGDQNITNLISKNDLERLKLLLEINKDLLNLPRRSGFFPLHYAVFFGRLDIVKYLVSIGAEINIRVKCTHDSEKAYRRMTPLELAINQEQLDIVRFLMAQSVDLQLINNSKQALFFAAKHGLLLLMEVMINENPELLDITNNNHQTALSIAALHGQLEVVEYLIEMDVELNPVTKKARSFFHSECPDKGATPLDLAIKNKHWEVVDVLVEAGARAKFFSVEDRSKDIQEEPSAACSSGY